MGKIAVIRRNGLGDLLHAYPMITFLQKNPENWITLFVDEGNYPLVKYLPKVDEVVCFPAAGNKYHNVLSTMISYRKRKFDLAISVKTSPMKLMNLALFCSGAKKTRAYIDGGWHSQLINTPIVYTEKVASCHQALKGLKLVAEQMDYLPQELVPKIELSSYSIHPALLNQKKRPIFLISASTNNQECNFDSLRYAKVTSQFCKEHGMTATIVSLKKNALRAQLIAKNLTVPYEIYYPDFDEMIQRLWLADMVFVPDGGISHIVAAMGKPQLVLFGKCHPNLWHPMSHKTRCLFHPLHVNCLSDDVICQSLDKAYCS